VNSAFDDAMQLADDGLFSAFGVAATAQRGADPAVAVTVVIERNIAKLGDYGQVVGRVDKISLRNREWIAQQGDVIVIDGNSRKVDTPENDDGLVNVAVLHG
jgi:hypothetical protein